MPHRRKNDTDLSGIRVAIAHDYLTQRGGAERVVMSLLRAFPDATGFTTLYNPATSYPEFRKAKIVTSSPVSATPSCAGRTPTRQRWSPPHMRTSG